MRISDPAQAASLRNSIESAFAQTQEVEAEQRRLLAKQISKTTNELDRLSTASWKG